MRYSIGSLMALLAFAAPALGQEAIELEKLCIPHEKFVLGNGLTVLVHEDHGVPIVAVNLWYHVGSQNEQRGRKRQPAGMAFGDGTRPGIDGRTLRRALRLGSERNRPDV